MSNQKILRTVTRKQGIAQASPERHTALRRASEELSRRNVDAAIVELLNEALARLTVLCYERDEEGALCNVDPATGRVLIPLPWGRAGFAKWGLTVSEAGTLRGIMFIRQRRGLPLFFYERNRRAWYLNIVEYRSGSLVLAQLKEWEISIAEYREARVKGS